MLNDKDRLFIKKIEIKNCGRFYGDDHVIHLSDPSEKKCYHNTWESIINIFKFFIVFIQFFL